MRSRAQVWGLLVFVAASTPFALAVETGLRQLLFPPEFAEIRSFLRPTLTRWTWWTPVAAAASIPCAFWLQRRLTRVRLRGKARTPEAAAAAHFDALMLSTSVPQVPALLATFGFMFGSSLAPVAAAMAVAMAGVLSLGLTLRRTPPVDAPSAAVIRR